MEHDSDHTSEETPASSSLLGKPVYDVKDKSQLRSLVFKDKGDQPYGIDVADLKDAYPNVMEDLQALKASGDITWSTSGTLSKGGGVIYPRFKCENIQFSDKLLALYNAIKLPGDFRQVEEDLRKRGMVPAAQMHNSLSINKPEHEKKKKKKKKSKEQAITKTTNAHLPELFQGLNLING